MDIRITSDGIVSFEETKVLKQVAIKDFIENLKSIKPISTGFLPSGCILYSKIEGNSVYVFEETPHVHILNWNGRSIAGVVPYPISLPFIYWIVWTNEKFVTKVNGRASLTPVRDLDQEVFNMGLPNFYDSGEGDLCRGSTNISCEKAKSVVPALWDTNWNGDLHIMYPNGIKSYQEWAEATLKDPLFWMKLKLQPCRRNTIGGILESG